MRHLTDSDVVHTFLQKLSGFGKRAEPKSGVWQGLRRYVARHSVLIPAVIVLEIHRRDLAKLSLELLLSL